MIPDPLALEQAAFRSWPALEEVNRNGWILRCAGGHTKRCNSANPLVPAGTHMEEDVAFCEAFYRERFQPSIFRLTSFVDNGRLDSYLDAEGYSFLDSSQILGVDLSPIEINKGEVSNEDRHSWLKAYCEISEVDPAKQSVHSKILEGIVPPSLFAVRRHEGEAVACGIGVIHQGLFGVFDFVTAARYRRLGRGTELLGAMLLWAKERRAVFAYVQVLASNTAALRLYEKFGYRSQYDYWYRKKALARLEPPVGQEAGP